MVDCALPAQGVAVAAKLIALLQSSLARLQA